jgi:hypothetical protein
MFSPPPQAIRLVLRNALDVLGLQEQLGLTLEGAEGLRVALEGRGQVVRGPGGQEVGQWDREGFWQRTRADHQADAVELHDWHPLAGAGQVEGDPHQPLDSADRRHIQLPRPIQERARDPPDRALEAYEGQVNDGGFMRLNHGITVRFWGLSHLRLELITIGRSSWTCPASCPSLRTARSIAARRRFTSANRRSALDETDQWEKFPRCAVTR